MPILPKSQIKPNEIINEFNQVVVNTILTDVYDINNPPMDEIYYCVEQEKLGDKNSITIPNIGLKGSLIIASDLYNALVAVTTALTRVGTFSYVRTYRESRTVYSLTVEGESHVEENISTVKEASGTAFFTEEYVKNLASFSDADVVKKALIKATGIHTLIGNLLTAWENTTKHHNELTVESCHTDCNCYTGSCYSETNCYK